MMEAIEFDANGLRKVIQMEEELDLDSLLFGLVKVNSKGVILNYNKFESSLSRRSQMDVLGRDFFREVAPCTKVDEFYGRFLKGVESGHLDDQISYEFKFDELPIQVDIAMMSGDTPDDFWLFIRPL